MSKHAHAGEWRRKPPSLEEQTEGLGLFDQPPAVDVDTSIEAAASMRDAAGTLRRQVLAELIAKDGATCEELCGLLGLDGNTVRPRLWELEKMNLARKRLETRGTASGRRARVYEATAAGRTALEG